MVKETKTKKETKKKAVWEMWFAYIDNNNKIQNALADVNYEINNRDRMHQAQEELRQFANGNYRCLLNYKILRKKYVEK